MITTQMLELLDRIKAGQLDPAGVTALEQVKADSLVTQLESDYGIGFQDRRLRGKWEVGLARRRIFKMAAKRLKDSPFPIFIPVCVFRDCLLLSSEACVMTGLAIMAYLQVTPVRKKSSWEYALSSGQGFNLYKKPDGWAIKPMQKRTVILTQEFLNGRGWRFEEMMPFPS